MSLFKRNGKWVIQWRSKKRMKTQTVGTDKTAAQRLLNKLNEQEAARKQGMIDPDAERYATMNDRLIDLQISDYKAYLQSRDGSAKQIGQVITRIEKVCNLGGIGWLNQITESSVGTAINALKLTPYKVGNQSRTRSAETLNQHMKAMRQFARWLFNDGRIRRYPLGNLKLFNIATDRRHDRRALSEAEIALILNPTYLASDTRAAINPTDRAMLYRLALTTGFRAGELASLTVDSFDLESATVTLDARKSKHRRMDIQPLPAETVEALRPWLAAKVSTSRARSGLGRFSLFAMPQNMAKVFRRDLATAGVEYVKGGKYADFHALRHTFITRLIAANISPKDAQALARHSTIVLTLDRYTHVNRDKLGEQLKKLPPLPNVQSPFVGAVWMSAVPVLHTMGRLGQDQANVFQTSTGGDNWWNSEVLPEYINGHKGIMEVEAMRPAGLEPTTVRLEGKRARSGKYRQPKSYQKYKPVRCTGAAYPTPVSRLRGGK